MRRRRVFVTGIGCVTPHGDAPEAMFDRLCAGEVAIRREPLIRSPDQEGAVVARARWNPEAELTPRQRSSLDPVAQMGLVAGRHALQQAGLEPHDALLTNAGLSVGCALGGITTQEEVYDRYYTHRLRTFRPTSIPRVMANATAAHLGMALGIKGPNHTYSVACASSAAAIGEAFRAIRDGYLDCVMAGGAEAMVTDLVLQTWAAAGVLAAIHANGPAASVRPFDAARSGFVLGEGAVMLVLESEDQVTRRGATVLGELVGYGASSDGHSITQPQQEGQVRAMRTALADAAIPPEAIGYVNAHATATPVGDAVEVAALREVFGEHLPALPISATKAMHGHLVGAAGALELAVTLLAVKHGRIPPTVNLHQPDVGDDLDLVPLVGRVTPGLTLAMSTSFAFGGANVSLIVRRVAD